MDFWKGIAALVISMVVFAVAFFTVGAQTGTQGDPLWLKLAAVPFGLVVLFFVLFPAYRQSQQARASAEIQQSIADGRYAQALQSANEAKSRWPKWSDAWAFVGTTELLLWRTEAAHVSLSRALKESKTEPAQGTLCLVLLAAEMLGVADRERQAASTLPPDRLAIPNAIRAARASDWATVRALLLSEHVQKMGGERERAL